jgi:hypothetical protein
VEFSKALAQIIAAAYFNPDHCVLIRLPRPNEDSADLFQQLTVLLDAILGSRVVMPRIPAPNILLLRHDLPESSLDAHHDRVDIMFDSSFDFWCYTRAFYRRLHSVSYIPSGDENAIKTVVRCFSAMLGRAPAANRGTAAAVPWLLTWAAGKTGATRRK